VRIQIIDDEKAIAQTLKEFLESLGYECEAFTDPRKALERHGETHFDVVLTDLRMPWIDGFQLMSILAAGSPAPVMIAMTGHSGLENAMACLDCGAYAYFTKPLDLRWLYSILSNLEQKIAAKPPVKRAAAVYTATVISGPVESAIPSGHGHGAAPKQANRVQGKKRPEQVIPLEEKDFLDF